MAIIGKDIHAAADLLLNGRVVGIPTETVYGLAANALDEKAVLQIFQVKERPFFDPLIVHVPDLSVARKYALLDDPRLQKLAERFWPGPLTLLLPKRDIIPALVTSGLPQVAIRVPHHHLILELLRIIGVPLAAPSANPFGYVSPTTAEHVNKQLGEKISYILDGGPSTVGLESTIVGIEDDLVCVYRLGGLPVETLENAIGKVELRLNISSDPKAPGQLKNHYAPKKPLVIGDIDPLIKLHKNKKMAVISFGSHNFDLPGIIHYNLSLSGDIDEAAVNLFKYLRQADDSAAEIVITGYLPEEGLGKAINDRLRRASAR